MLSVWFWVFLNVAEDVFALYRVSRQLVIFRCLVFCLGPVYNLVHRDKVEGDEEETAVYLETKDTSN